MVTVRCNVDESKTQDIIGWGIIIIGIFTLALLVLKETGVIAPYSCG